MEKKFRYVDASKPVVSPEPHTTLHVFCRAANDVAYLGVQELPGRGWAVVGLRPDGRIERHCDISPFLGLPLDSKGRVLFDDEPPVVDITPELALLREFVTAMAEGLTGEFADKQNFTFGFLEAASLGKAQQGLALALLEKIAAMHKGATT